MCAPTTQPDLLDRGLANAARLFGPIVNPRHAAIIAVGALDIEIITESGTTLIDRGLEDIDDRCPQ